MKDYQKELAQVCYNTAAVKVSNFKVPMKQICFRIHWHERMEFILVRKGEMYIDSGNTIRKLHAGELAIFPPKMPHRGRTLDSVVDYDVIMFDIRSFYNDTELCKTYLPTIYDGRAIFTTVTSEPNTIDCFNEICQNAKNDFLDTTANIYRFIFLLFKHSLVELRERTVQENSVMSIIEYIEENYNQNITTATISEEFGYTSTHLCYKFRKAIGLSPMKYLNIYRLEKAYKLLKNGEQNISEIAFRCGFSDANYFTRCFKDHFGKAPSQFRVSPKEKEKASPPSP